MRRRDLLIAGLATGVAGPALAETSRLRVAAREAFIYALPLTEVANVRARLLGAGLPSGRFFPQRVLATPEARNVTTPNNDTVYATTFIDLSRGPAKLTLPPLGDRYASLAIMDMFSDNIAVLGTRTTGSDGGVFTLVGPTAAASAGAIRSPTPWVWVLARVVVNGPSDLPAAAAVLSGFGVEAAPAGSSWAPGANRNGPWAAWFKSANALMLENPAPATDAAVLRRMAPLGLATPGFDPGRFSAAEAAEIAAGVDDARQMIRIEGFGGKTIGGWVYQAADAGNFFQDYLGRARIAVGGLAALPPAEAMYLTAVSPEGRTRFDGDGFWRLRLRGDALPPVDAFWSLTMYEAEPEGGFFLTHNPINRYAIGDRTPGLSRGADGSLDIWVSRTDPGGRRSANWLPAPAKGPFTMVLRAYLPKSQLISQSYTPPAIEKV
jgi:hypothetical protein